MRPLGDISLDIEPFLLEMVEDHDLQISDIMGLIYGYLKAHTIAEEEYVDGSFPIYFYGNKKQLKKMAKQIK